MVVDQDDFGERWCGLLRQSCVCVRGPVDIPGCQCLPNRRSSDWVDVPTSSPGKARACGVLRLRPNQGCRSLTHVRELRQVEV